MSAPDTNVEKQVRRHRPALYGIALALIVAAVVAVTLIAWDIVPADEQAAPAVAVEAD